MRTTAAILWHDLIGRTVCRVFGHAWREVPLGHFDVAFTCGVCKDFRVPTVAGGRP